MRISLLLLCLFIVSGCGQQAPAPQATPAPTTDDYLSGELRGQVEALKAAVKQAPTDQSTAAERSNIVFDWINAYALDGRTVPVEATSVVAQINAYGLPRGDALDAFIAELSLNDENPKAVGTLTASTEVFTVRQYATFTQTYTVGEAPVAEGGAFLVPKHFQTNHPPFQANNPEAANYVSIASSNGDVSFSEERIQIGGMHGGFRGAEGQLAFRVRGGTLNPGDTVTVTYGDKSRGGDGLLMPDFSSEQMPFPLYVDLDGSGLWLSLPIQPINVTGDVIHAVAGFAPSIVATGESVQVSIRAEDRFGNRAVGPMPDWQIIRDGSTIATVASNNNAVVTTDLTFDEPGVHRLQLRSRDGAVVGEFNPVLVRDNPAQRIYWGDTHGHSGFAEGIGSADAYMRFARDEARLDFVTHSEHDIWMDDSEWETLKSMVKKYNEPGKFVAFLGYEWTVQQSQGGHNNVLFRTADNRERMPSQHYPLLSRLYQGLRTKYDVNDVLLIPHAHQRGEYRIADPEMTNLVEIMSMHGTFEWFGRMFLNHGHHVGFIAASDDHIGRPGYAPPKSSSLAQRNGLGAVIAGERTHDAIFDAMKALSVYATTGQRIIAELSVNGTPIGGRADYADERAIEGTVIGTSPIRSVALFKNDRVLQEWDYVKADPNELTLSFYSDSQSYHPQDNPRGWRHWRGTIEVTNATVETATLVDYQNISQQRFERDPASPNRIHFRTLTRGDHSSIQMKLNGVGSNTRINITLEDAQETGSGPPLLRPHKMIPGQTVQLRVGDMKGDQLRKDMAFDSYQDEIILSRGGVMPLEVDVSFLDKEGRQGDYYFLRARQADEGIVWTSPVWIGGSPPR